MSILVMTLAVHWGVFYIIHCFYILGPGWLFCPRLWLSLILLWTQLYIQYCIVYLLIQVRYVRYWVWCNPLMIIQVRMRNLLDTAWLISWFGHLVIPHEWVVLCLLMDNVVYPIENNNVLSQYRWFLFYFYFLGSDEWCCSHKIMLIYHSYCSLSFTWPIIHLDSSFILCAPHHSVCIGLCLLAPLTNICKIIACVAVDDRVLMWPSISLLIHFWNIFFPYGFYFSLKCLSYLPPISCSILYQAFNGGC